MAANALRRLGAAALLSALCACGGRNTVDTVTTPAGGSMGSSSEPSRGGASGATHVAAAGTAGMAQSVGGGPGAPCTSVADCPMPPSESSCTKYACNQGRCEFVNLQKGALIAHHSPPDCHSDVCDGQGNVQSAYDPSQVPNTDNACLMSACTEDGPQILPRPAATPCMSSNGGTLCDGSGQCVPCLLSKSCPSGQACMNDRCVTIASCSNKQQDGSETDVDCGGAECAPCADGSQCNGDQDCASDTCKPLAKLCSPATCIDEAEDAGETDVDCGGACRGCIPGQKCLVDADCTTHECDPTKHTCGGNSCADKLEDGDESDVDCGGPECGGCLNGKKCNSSFDCAEGTCQANVTPHVCK